METCIICGREFKRLTHTHLEQAHGLSQEAYKSLLITSGGSAMDTVGEEEKVPQNTMLGLLNGLWSRK